MTKLTWKQDGYLHFAHAKEGMYTIEQKRGRYIVTLEGGQDMGWYTTLAKAKAGAQKDHRALEKLD